MPFPRYLCAGVLLMTLPAAAQSGRPSSVRRISVVGQDPFQLRIETSRPVTPQTQMVSSPERLVIDMPNATPGEGLHGLKIQREEVRGVRTSLFSTAPPVTRVVIDLNAPQWYRVAPDATGVLVTLGNNYDSADNGQPTIGWLATTAPASSVAVRTKPAAIKKNLAPASRPATVNGVSIQFADGMMAVHARNATLSEVLFQIQKATGAEMAIPSGTEQDRVSEDLGPGPPSEVLAQLLNGSGLNFVVVGSEADPNLLRSVILTRKSGAPDDAAPAYASQPVVENSEPAPQEVVPPPAEENAPPPQPLPAGGPPADPPPTD
ncbi:MAG TPA: AMIN domain-containing protein [Terriglobales bacterium]|nr:AMIN domain-containing protein [Terriglobales bacterium]